MTIETIIEEVVRSIQRYAKPQRIWLYGSRASGEATDASDIDIAFDDPEFQEMWRIEEDVATLPTLLKIDVKNIAQTEERFRQRVVSTGRVLFSASKFLRFEDGLYNLRRAHERFAECLDRKGQLEQEGFGDIFLDLAVKRFEFTYEMSWKALRRYLDFVGMSVGSPRGSFKEGFAQGLIVDEGLWLEMIERRNLSSHVYDLNQVAGILPRLEDYCAAFERLVAELEQRAHQERVNG